LRLIEDCSTLEVLMIHVDGLRSPRVRRVHAEHDEMRYSPTASSR
jgi:hypothetical protein